MKFKIGDEVIVRKNSRYSYQKNEGKQIIEKHSLMSGYDWKTDKGYNYSETDLEFYKDISKYDLLKSRISSLSATTTLQEFGELLLEVGKRQRKWLCLPVNLSHDFAIDEGSNKPSLISVHANAPCDAIPALKKCFMWLLDNNPDIKKTDEKQEKIETLRKELAEFTEKIEKKIRELEGGN